MTVLVTLATVRGHAPREAGAKMVVGLQGTYGSVGGGNLEATAVDRARQMLRLGRAEPELLTLRLTDRAPAEFGRQCCGGEVTLLLEVVQAARPAVAIFGVGHVGLALARILVTLDIELHLIDSREVQPSQDEGRSTDGDEQPHRGAGQGEQVDGAAEGDDPGEMGDALGTVPLW